MRSVELLAKMLVLPGAGTRELIIPRRGRLHPLACSGKVSQRANRVGSGTNPFWDKIVVQSQSRVTSGKAGPQGAMRPGAWAWGICWLMFASTVLNYMDRQAIALVGPQIKERFVLDNAGFGWVLAAFQLTYAFFQWPAGYVVDRWDVRRTYAGAVLWWSLAGIATAFAPTLGILMVFRALLGMGESFNWPCACGSPRECCHRLTAAWATASSTRERPSAPCSPL